MRQGIVAAIMGLAFAGAAVAAPVKVTGGQIEGKVEDGLTIYRGIPFAAPPVGRLRWKPPQAVPAWAGVKRTVEFGPACMQGTRTLFPEDAVQSEDCLTLNVWTPSTTSTSSGRLPVMVWIYGGGFTMGSTRPPLYSGANFARQGVVLVSIQYRVGRFGFFAHPAITREDPNGLKGNYAIMDQIAGLQWVKNNIAAFGGDPRNVTIFGESAGGVSIHALMATPAARDLFQKAISESGFARSIGITMQAAEAQGSTFAQGHNITGDGPASASALRALSADDVLAQGTPGGRGDGRAGAAGRPGAPAAAGRGSSGAPSAAPAAQNGPPQPGGAPGGLPYPIIDGKLFPDQITQIFEQGKQAHVPYLAGGNSYEASLFSQVRAQPQAAFDRTGDGARAAALYVTGERDAGLGALDMTTDLQVTEPVRYLGRLMAKVGQQAYAYYFSYLPADRRATVPGVSHGGELGYVFGVLAPTATAEAKALSRDMSAAWVAFAKTGNPSITGGPRWEPVGKDSYAYMEFGADGPKLRRDFLKPKLDFISGLTDKH